MIVGRCLNSVLSKYNLDRITVLKNGKQKSTTYSNLNTYNHNNYIQFTLFVI